MMYQLLQHLAIYSVLHILLSVVFFKIHKMSQELRSLLLGLIPEPILSQNCHIHMGPIHNGSGVMSF